MQEVEFPRYLINTPSPYTTKEELEAYKSLDGWLQVGMCNVARFLSNKIHRVNKDSLIL